MPDTLQPVDDPDYRPDADLAARGAVVYGTHCYVCHGSNAVAAGTAPDLRTSAALLDAPTLRSIVHDGALTANGMPKFEELDDQALAALRHYLRQEAATWRSAKN